MKRFFAALLTLTCMLSLSACREEQAAAKPVIYLYPEEETGWDSDRRCRADLQLSLLGGHGYHRV